jgi:CRP-like cAMP-binding protein
MRNEEKRKALQPFFARLEIRDEVSAEEKDALVAAAQTSKTYPARSTIVREGDRPKVSTLVVSGMSARYKLTREGQRQITCLHMAGDFVDLHSFPLKIMDHTVGAVTDCVVLEFPHQGILEITERFPHLTRMLWLMTLLDGALHRQWIVAMGSQLAVSHMAHFLCEIFVRSQVVGLAEGTRFDLPLTQEELGEALGLSTVHVNRCLQELRRRGLIRTEGTKVDLPDLERLAELGEFDPTFLHLEKEPR